MPKLISELVRNGSVINSTKLHEKISRKTALPNSWISSLFKKFRIIFGSKWVTQIDGAEHEYIFEWADGLKNLNGEQIKNGLGECRLLDWPPSMAEFVKLCEGEKKPSMHGAAYKPFASLPKPRIDKIKARAAITECKRILGRYHG